MQRDARLFPGFAWNLPAGGPSSEVVAGSLEMTTVSSSSRILTAAAPETRYDPLVGAIKPNEAVSGSASIVSPIAVTVILLKLLKRS